MIYEKKRAGTDNNYYIDLNVNSVVPYYNQTGIWLDPIDTLQTLYDQWYDSSFAYELGDINQDYIIDILDIIILVNGIFLLCNLYKYKTVSTVLSNSSYGTLRINFLITVNL